MKIVLLESLGISREKLEECARPFVEAGHTFEAYERTDDLDELVRRGKDAQAVMPVSYTHLDVYKRQSLLSADLPMMTSAAVLPLR